MKTIKLLLVGTISSAFLLLACQRNSEDNLLSVPADKANVNSPATSSSRYSRDEVPSSGQCNSSAYIINLEGGAPTLVNGNWEWIWTVQNSNPGNGNNGTFQDLSNWGMQFGVCIDEIIPYITGAAFSSDGINWTSFTPVYEVDPSQNCMTTQVLKFDFGTSGGAKSWYKLIISKELPVGNLIGYYKSGKVTGCCTFEIELGGVSCGDIR